MRQSGSDLRALGAAIVHVIGALVLRQLPAFVSAVYGPRGLRFLLNVATALLVLALPLSVTGNLSSTEPATNAPASFATSSDLIGVVEDVAPRAVLSARGLLAGSRSPTTVSAADAPEIKRHAVKKGDTLSDIARGYGVAADDLAFANGIEDEGQMLALGHELIIPPGRGALYFVKEGDTVASVADRFKVDQAAIMSYNRLYFEPEHFAPEQLIFVPGAEVPAMRRVEVTRTISIPTAQLPARTGRLSLPVRGVITQQFWWGHSGVDVAAPYGSGVASSDDGVVVATGWVPVGGLRVCVQHGGGMETCYYHLSSVYVTPGETVARGQHIAAIGMTGVTTGPHVHWEARLNGALVNPLGN